MAPKSQLEREVKLAVPSGFRLPDLGRLAGGLSVSPEEVLTHTAVYYDTAELHLARWDCGLRHRTSDGWTLKLGDEGAGAAVERREFRFAGAAAAPPEAALDLVQAFTRGRSLEPVARLRTERRRVLLRAPSGDTWVEVTDDAVTVLEGRAQDTGFREVEVEFATDCPPERVEEVLALLRAAGAGASHRIAKHARALGLEAGVEPELVVPEVDAASDLRTVLRWALAGPVDQLVRSDPGVRADEEVEDVHRMRVATRRLRSHLRTFRPLLDADWAAALQDELRELGAALGGVRDSDVLGQRLLRAGGPRPEPDRRPEPEQRAAKELLDRLAEARALERARLLESLRSDRQGALVERLIAAAREPRLAVEATAPAAALLAPCVLRRWRRLRRAARDLGREPSDAELHRVRIAAKHARYAAEAVTPVFGKPVRRLARAMRPLQDVLGDRNDAVVAAEWLRVAAARVSSEAAFGAGRLAAREQRAAQRDLRAWKSAWRDARSRARKGEAVLRAAARTKKR